MITWFRRRKKGTQDPDLARAEKKVQELTTRAEKIVRDNHLAMDIKKALGAR